MKTPIFTVKNISLDSIAVLLQKCLKSKALKPGKQVHAFLTYTATDLNKMSMNSKLVGMYASCGDLKNANFMLNQTPKPNIFALNWMVLSSTFTGYHEKAIGYVCLLRELISFYNKFTYSVLLKACVGLADVDKGKQVHGLVCVMGFDCEVSVGNALIDMYCKCGSIVYARNVFDRMLNRDVASWTSMISGYCNLGMIEEGLVLFERMKIEGLEPNDFTWNAMIAGYARNGDSKNVFDFFSRMTRVGLVPDLITWNAMISGLAQAKLGNKALKLFTDMLVSGVKPNQVTITGLLPACGSTGFVQSGREVHGLIYRMGLDVNFFVASALIDMYSKCGSIEFARNVFDSIPIKNVASWNAMIGCYGKQGTADLSIQLFKRMRREGIQPNEVTLTCVLSACSHNGMVNEGLEIFRSMKEKYAVEASVEHYACVVDMLCRSGKMVEAYGLVKEMHIDITESIIGSFFNGCKIHGRRDLAKMMADDILRMELRKPGGFITLSNIYAAGEEWDEVENLRKLMKVKNVHKHPGFSWSSASELT